jgi:hypothetical protein
MIGQLGLVVGRANPRMFNSPRLKNRFGKLLGRVAGFGNQGITHADERQDGQVQIEDHVTKRIARFEQAGRLHEDQRHSTSQA